MTDITATARTLAANLKGEDIAIKHVQALDLLAAGAGLANRHVLSKNDSLPAIKRVNIRLLTTAATVLAQHDLLRRHKIVDATAQVLMPELASSGMVELDEYDFRILPHEAGNPDLFLQTDRGEKFVAKLCSGLYYTRYETDRSSKSMSLDQGNSLGAKILEAKAKAAKSDEISEEGLINEAMYEHFGEGTDLRWEWWDYNRGEVSKTINAINSDLEDFGLELDDEDWLSALEDPICEALEDEDDSTPRDLLDRFDLCEAIFLIKAEGYTIDEMISSNRSWADFADLHVGPELQYPLSRMGYSIADYRKISGNRNEGEDLMRGLKKRSERLVSPEKLQEMVENACSQNFLFVLYAIMPVQDLIGLDLSKPLQFSDAAIATYNPYAGTFHDAAKTGPITMTAKDGELATGDIGYSPDGICGFVHSYYRATITNPKEAPEAPAPKAPAYA
ncbi:hypothetical protein [Erythrobacter aureus]|uniref:Uncharacterized protein n=1 Tax=Erythrobacter aureus TaxID=2182384 RepID=A0A345YJ12_9SPHN|nr:hypothetical protein [Erythrobacter aureus]AXK43914.1 hypothetical protein DVR09_15785 [Erythrobacter aureus]